MNSKILNRHLLALATLGLCLSSSLHAQDGENKLGTPITSLPYNITASGVYSVNTELPPTTIQSGAAIAISVDNVTLELNGHTLSNTTSGNTAEGIYAADHKNITVRNGAVRGFFVGVDLPSSVADGSRSFAHVVEDMAVSGSTWFGIRVYGNGNVIRHCQVYSSGGSAAGDSNGYGIIVQTGSGNRVLDNEVTGVAAVDTAHLSFGICLLGSAESFVVNNQISQCGNGVYYDGGSSGKYRDNLIGIGVRYPFTGGTDATGNMVGDSNNNGIPDSWEWQYFGNLNHLDPNEDYDGDGLTNLQEYQQGKDPTDYFNGARPTLQIIGGNNQTARPNNFVPLPLIVNLADANGNPIAGAPVTFSVSQGGGQVQQSYSSAPGPSFTVLTDGNGQATAFCKLPDAASSSGSVVASLTSGTQTVSVTFTETSDDGTGTYRSPFSPSFVTGQRNPDGSEDLSWVNNTDDTTPVIIYAKQSDGSWTPLLTLPPGTTSCHIAAAQGPVQSYGVGAPGTSVTPPYYPIPVQSYAEVDVSGDDPSNSPVTGINLRDDNQLAFCVSQYDSQGEQASVTVKTWANGTVADKQTMQCFQQWFSADGQHLLHSRSLDIWPFLLSANGDLCGNQIDEYFGPDPTADDPSTAPWTEIGITGGAFSAGAFTSPMPPFILPNPPLNTLNISGLAYSTNILGSSYSGASLYTISGLGHPDANGNLTMLEGVMACTTPNTLFGIPADPSSAITISPDYFEPGISYGMINSQGWVIPQTGSPGKVWDGTKYISLPGNGMLVNESNDVISGDYTSVHPETLGLLQKGSTYLPFFSSGTTPGMIPPKFQSEVQLLYPLAMSNRLVGLPASPAVPVLHILLEGQILRSSGTATWWEWTYFLLRQLSDGTTDFYEANSPLALGAGTDGGKINANGLLCVAADPDDDSGPTAQAHAFLLVPITFTVTRWEPTATDPIVQYNNSSYSFLSITPADANAMDILTTTSISIPANFPHADDLAAEWDIYLFQDLESATDPGTLKFSSETWLTTLGGLPGQDMSADGGGQEDSDIPKFKSYSKNNQSIDLSFEDSAGMIASRNDGYASRPGILQSVSKNVNFRTYLFAQHRSDKRRVFLKWMTWNLTIDVSFDFSKSPPDKAKTLKTSILGQGNGVGPKSPVDTPFSHKSDYLPPR